MDATTVAELCRVVTEQTARSRSLASDAHKYKAMIGLTVVLSLLAVLLTVILLRQRLQLRSVWPALHAHVTALTWDWWVSWSTAAP